MLPVLVAAAALGAVATAGLMSRGSTSADVGKPTAVSETALRVAVWPRGIRESRASRWTLRCKPVGGSHPRPVAACAALAEHPDALEDLPGDIVCTEIYGGPQVAEVRGTLDGQVVSARFTRSDGCQIARWNRLRALFPVRV